MEAQNSEQKIFKGIVTDINEINIDIGKGAVADNFNGRILAIGGDKYSWTSESGTTKIFSIPNEPGESVAAVPAKTRIYMFDDRLYDTSGRKHVLKQSTADGTDRYYEYILSIQAYNAAFTDIYYPSVYPSSIDPLQIRIKQKVTFTAGVPVGYIYLSYRMGVSGAWVNEQNYLFYSRPGNLKTVFVLHEKLKDYINTQITIPSTNGLYGMVAAMLGPSDGTVCIELTASASSPINILVKNLEGESSESATNFIRNRFGFGAGSLHKNLSYPNAPEYPVPGSDYPLNPFADDKPWGVLDTFRDNKWYYVLSGRVQYFVGGSLQTLDPAGKFLSSVYSEDIENQDPYFWLRPYNSETPHIVEVEPKGFGYGIVVQRYAPAYVKKTMAFKNVGFVSISKTKCLMFMAIGSEHTKIYEIDTSNNLITINLKLNTTENIDITDERTILGFCKIDDLNNQRVYWTSGFGHIRTFNIADPPTSNIDFNTRLVKPCNFGEINITSVNKSGGGLLCGSYRFCFALSIDGVVWTRASQHTGVVMIGQSYWGVEGLVGSADTKTATYPKPNREQEPAYRGANPGTKTTESIEITITNIDQRYRYIKVFSIENISGSASSVTNCIYQGKLLTRELYYFTCVHMGATNVVEGNMNLSEVTQRKKVPINVKWISQINNRMIAANFSEEYHFRSELQNNALSQANTHPDIVKTKQRIGCDTSYSLEKTPNGFKYWLNQYLYKSFPVIVKESYAWVYIDEYGNESEPSTPFQIELDFRKKKLAEYEATRYAQSEGYNSKNYRDNLWTTTNQEFLFVDHDSQTQDNTALIPIGGYMLHSYGAFIKKNGIWPSWAKKAILVQKKQQLEKRNIISEGFGLLTANGIIMGYVPDADGYNIYDNYSFRQGDQIRIIASSRMDAKSNSNYVDPTVYHFVTHPNSFIGATEQDYLFDITGYLQKIYPLNSELGYSESPVNELKMPDDTINMRAIDFAFNIPSAIYSAIYGATPANPVTTARKVWVRFLIERPLNSVPISEDIEYYKNTGFSIDLTSRYAGEYRRAFIGDCFVSTNHQMITMRNNFYAGNANYLDYSSTIGMSTWLGFSPCVVAPLITRFNMAMADDSAFPFFRMNGVIRSYNAAGFKLFNRDYAVSNDLNIYQFIDPNFLKTRNQFKNVWLFSDASVIGQNYDSYSKLNPLNQIECPSDFGDISGVYEVKNFIVVIQSYGSRRYAMNSKEFVQTTGGNLVTVGAGSFVDPSYINIDTFIGSEYPGLQTDKGIYIISSRNNQLCLVTPEHVVLISREAGFSKLFNDEQFEKDNRTIWNFNGISLFSDKDEMHLIYIYIKSRPVYGLYIFNIGVIDILKSSKLPKVGEIYSLVKSESEKKTMLYFKVDGVETLTLKTRLYYTVSFEVPCSVGFETNKIYLTTVQEPLLVAYHEQEEVLEFRSSNYRIGPEINQVFVDDFFGNQINCLGGSSAFFEFSESSPKIPFGTKLGANIFVTDLITTIEPNSTLSSYSTNFKLNIPGLTTVSKYVLASNKEFHFVKGVKYTIGFNMSLNGATIVNFTKMFFGPIYDLLVLNCSPVGFTDFLSQAVTPVSLTKQYSFIVNKSFVSPLAIYGTGLNSANNVLFTINITKLDYTQTFESHIEPYVSAGKSDIISLDNLILSGKQDSIPDRIEVYSKEQGETLVISSPGNYGKMRLRQFQMALPKLSTGERLRSTYYKIKFVYVSNGSKKIVNALKSFFRTV